ncbi:septation regulator SpoVG [Intestinibacillus massiliensis]|uniref:septation regulator SpoVG n=1 Tax=Intestinibacillus massiliensis TaxID=1871029 RepID=UPI000B35A0AB|nr:septation regulator SpoVG [Intestinibacillus massiliensis]MCB6365564.1 septation regulator SpoVG [Intestinibacillus massiliensis]
MQITDVKFRHLQDEGKLKALVSVTFDGVFAVHDIKLIDGHDRLFLAMPSRRMPDGKYRDIVHPIGSELRDLLEDRVITEYNNTLKQ